MCVCQSYRLQFRPPLKQCFSKLLISSSILNSDSVQIEPNGPIGVCNTVSNQTVTCSYLLIDARYEEETAGSASDTEEMEDQERSEEIQIILYSSEYPLT